MCKGSNTTTTQSSPNAQALNAYNAILPQASNVAATPYQAYTGELVAPVNQQQTAGINNINANAGFATPYINAATNYATQAAAPITASQIQQYTNPYTQSVVNATQQQYNLNNAQQQQQVVGNAAAQGALGGDRVAVAQAQLAGQQQTAQAPVIAGLESQGYQTGLSTALTEQQQQAQAAYSLGNLGISGQNAALTGANAQVGAGTLQQQTQQASDTAQYQQYLQALAYPFQTTQWLAGVDTGVGSQMGGTSSTTAPQPSWLSQIAGLGIAGASVAGKAGAFAARGGAVPGFDSGGSVFNFSAQPYSGGVSWIPGNQIRMGSGPPPPPQSPSQQQQQQSNQILKDATTFGGSLGKWPTSSSDAGPEDPFAVASGGAIRLPRHNRIQLPHRYGGGSVAGFGTGSFVPHRDDGGSVALDDLAYAAPQTGAYSNGVPAAGIAPSWVVPQQPDFNDRYNAVAPVDTQGLAYQAPSVSGFPDAFNDRFGNIQQAPASLASPVPTDTGWRPDYSEFNAGTFVAPNALAENRNALITRGQQMAGINIPTPTPRPDFASDTAVASAPGEGGLAYDASQAGVAPPSSGGLAAQPVPQPQPPSHPSHGGLGADSDLWPSLMAAGFGMMASTSPFPGVAIGQGGLKGLAQYGQQQQEHLNERKVDLEAQKLSQEAKQHADTLALETERQHQGTWAEQQRVALEKTPFGWQRDNSGNLVPTMGGPHDPTQIRAEATAKRVPGMSDEALETMVQSYRAGNTGVLTNVGRGIQGADNINRFWDILSNQLKSEGASGRDLAAAKANFTAQSAASRTAATREANIETAANEARGTFPLVVEASQNVPRTSWVPVNRLLQMYREGTSSPEQGRLAVAIQGAITAYSQAMSRTGANSVHAQQHAEALISGVTSHEALVARLDQMDKEIAVAQAAPEKTRQDILDRIVNPKGQAQPNVPAAPASVPAAGVPPPEQREKGKVYPLPNGKNGLWTGTGWVMQ